MIVDDDPIALEVARERLEGAGYQVVTRESALGTSLAIRTEQPDMVLLDVNMPALKGDALALLLTESTRHIRSKIILFSAASSAELNGLARDCGAFGAVRKTGDASAFLRDIAYYMGRSV